MAEWRRLDVELARRGLARSRSHAAELIRAGAVSVDGHPAPKTSSPVESDSSIEVASRSPWVSRAAQKLESALDAFAIEVRGRLALDVGASTGGFTQVLLARGARRVVALDVGHGQLADVIRADPRVAVAERINIRHLDRPGLAVLADDPSAPDLVVIDVSFISLRLVLPRVVELLAPAGDVVALVKPQFEVGRSRLDDGVVKRRDVRHAAVRDIARAASELGMRVRGPVESPVVGATGNREYLLALSGEGPVDPTEWERTLDRLH